MTTATPPNPTAPAGDELDRVQTLVPDGPRRERSRWLRIGYPLALVLLVAAIPVLVWVGLQVILDSTDGQLVQRVSDPTEPGYEAVVDPTPTALMVSVDGAGKLDSAAVLALTSTGSGGVMSIPAGTLVPLAGGGQVSLRYLHDQGSPAAFNSAVESLLDLTFDEVRVVSPDDWAALVGPAAPITVSSPDPVVAANGTVTFPKGSIDLTAAEVWPYLSGKGAKESDLARLVRVQAFWRGWLSRIGTTGAAALGVPTDTGIGSVLLDLGDDQVQFETLPVSSSAPSLRNCTVSWLS